MKLVSSCLSCPPDMSPWSFPNNLTICTHSSLFLACIMDSVMQRCDQRQIEPIHLSSCFLPLYCNLSGTEQFLTLEWRSRRRKKRGKCSSWKLFGLINQKQNTENKTKRKKGNMHGGVVKRGERCWLIGSEWIYWKSSMGDIWPMLSISI